MKDESYYKNFYEQRYICLKKGFVSKMQSAIRVDLDCLKDLIELIDNPSLQAKFERRVQMLEKNIQNQSEF